MAERVETAVLFELLDRMERIERRLEAMCQDRSNVTRLWLSKRERAQELGMSVSWIEDRMAEGLPHRELGNKAQFRLQDVEGWLVSNGKLRSVA